MYILLTFCNKCMCTFFSPHLVTRKMNCYGVDSIHQRERLPATYFGSHHQQPSDQPTQEVSKDQTWAIDCEISAAFGWSHFDHLTVFLFGSHLDFLSLEFGHCV